MTNKSYFETIDSEIKAYILGFIAFNIRDVDTESENTHLMIQIDTKCQSVSNKIKYQLSEVGTDFDRDIFVVKSSDIINDMCRHLNAKDANSLKNLDISHFIKNNSKEYSVEFLKAFYEKYGKINTYETENGAEYICNITAYSKNNLDAFAEFFGIPYKSSNLFNLFQASYSNVNIIDLLGILYKKHDIRIKDELYVQFLKLLNLERPILKYIKSSPDAVTPTKANFSDVGYDVSIIGLHKTLSPTTALYKTGIKLEIPIGYYVELVPRSSISKSGYMLANSIGIIDCSYKGELLVALTKINSESPDIEFPFRCCQIILRKQNFPDMVEISEIEHTKRSDGGFGSSN